MKKKWRYIWSLTIGSFATSTLLLLGLWGMLGTSGSGEKGAGGGLLFVIFVPAVAFVGAISFFTALFSGHIIYNADPDSPAGNSQKYGVVSGVILVLVLVPAIFIFGIVGLSTEWWDAYTVSGAVILFFLSTITGTGICLLLAKLRNLFY